VSGTAINACTCYHPLFVFNQFGDLERCTLRAGNVIAYNLGNFLRTLATPEPIKDWSLTTLKDKLIKIGAKVVSHGRYVIFQMAEVAIARQMFREILRLIAELRPQPPPALA
jgi:DDE family transposase